MAIHDWSQVDAGIFHAFHHEWISELSRALNRRVLPPDYYALPEQHAAGFGPDVLTLQGATAAREPAADRQRGGGAAGVAVVPAPVPTAETDMEFYRRRQTPVVVRHVSGDRVVAMIEVISPGNKSTRHAMRSLVEKTCEMLERRVHLLLIDLFPPGPRNPRGLHAAIWEEIAGDDSVCSPDPPLELAAYEAALTVRAYVHYASIGGELPEMPLFLEPELCVQTPLQLTYDAAFAALPARWRGVLDNCG